MYSFDNFSFSSVDKFVSARLNSISSAVPPAQFVTPAKYQNCTKRRFQKPARSEVFLFAESAAICWKHDISSASEGAFQGILGCFFYMFNSFKKRYSSSYQITQS